jgi:hypothetical protein
VQFWVLGILAFAGLRWWPAADRWASPRWPIIATMVFTLLMMVISYGNPRFRVPIEPGIVIAASVAIVALFDRRRHDSDDRGADTVGTDVAAG